MNAMPDEGGGESEIDDRRPGVLVETPELATASDPGLPPLLSVAGRAALQRLLAAGIVLSRTHAGDYQELLKGELAVRQILAEMGLRMIIRSGYGMAALVRTIDGEMLDDSDEDQDEGDEDGENNRAILRVTRLKLIQTLVLLALRAYHRERERAQDARIIIDLETLKDRIKPFWPLLNAESRSDRRFYGAIRLLERTGILLSVRDNKDSREISPVITLALDAERFDSLIADFQRQIEQLQAEQGG